jgi:tRNA(His) guanylyltransferase
MTAPLDDLGDRMKGYEGVEAKRRLDVHLPICARIDGRRFSRFTRGFARPFDADLSRAMRAACAHLVEHTHARIGFVQSDEINLVWQAAGPEASIFFDGRVQKMCSVLAAMAAAVFIKALVETHAETVWSRLPTFDARVWQVPTREEAANVLLWRAIDARKNAVLSAAAARFSPRQMHGMKRENLRAMMANAGVDFDATYSREDRFGVFYRREVREVEIPDADWLVIPEKHRPASRTVVRSGVEPLRIGYFGDVQNRAAVIFDGAEPEAR